MVVILLSNNEIHAATLCDDRFHEGFDGEMIRVILVSR
jgi:hypothetical protein